MPDLLHRFNAQPPKVKVPPPVATPENLDAIEKIFVQAMQEQGKPAEAPKQFIPAAEARSQIMMRVIKKTHAFKTLAAILDRHEATIRKHWLKKTLQQRRNVLSEAWGTQMAVSHRPEFQIARQDLSQDQLNTESRVREAFMWPYINQDDLQKSQPLLMFMAARGRHHPSEFAEADAEAMRMGFFYNRALFTTEVSRHFMVLTGRKDWKHYGEIYDANEHDYGMQWVVDGKAMSAGKGLLVLEVQERILMFLAGCAKLILHDLQPEVLLNGPLQSQPEFHFKQDLEHASLTDMATETPYRVPARLDFARIATFMTARCDEAVNEIWSLREDPAYFAALMCDAKKHTLLTSDNTIVDWGRVITNELAYSYHQSEIYEVLKAQAKDLEELQTTHRDAIRPDRPLPEPYMDGILKFRRYLSHSTVAPLNRLKRAIFESSPFRDHYEMYEQDTAFGALTKMKLNPLVQIDETES